MMPLLRLLYAQAAATCNALARALSCKCPKKQARPQCEAVCLALMKSAY